jgi:Glycosyltransferase family 87
MRLLGWRAVAAASIVVVAFSFISVVFALALIKANPGEKDFVEYWAAEQGLVHKANPYDPRVVLDFERAAGFRLIRPEFWYSPPPALVFALPLGFLSATTGLIVWTILQFTCLSASLWQLWRLHGRPDTLLPLLGFLFAPAVICLEAGQISIFFLLGMVLFLSFHRSRPFLAGIALLPCILKPHLFLPFALVLLVWIVRTKSYPILTGFLAAFLAGCAIVLPFDPGAWSQYTQLMRNGDMMNEYIATLSVTLRFIVDRHAAWLQFVPAGLACAWAVKYFWTQKQQWQWMNQGLLVLAVSTMCAPYGWLFDESVLLPVVLSAALRVHAAGRPLWPIGLAAAAALVEVQQSVNVMSPFYLWTTPAWLACYLYSTYPKNRQPQQDLEPPGIPVTTAGNQ